MKRGIGIVTSGFLPVPATKGGAVENLIMNLIEQNEKEKKIKMVVFSTYDEQAVHYAESFEMTDFIFFKPIKIVKILDKVTFFVAKNILRRNNAQTYRYIFQRLHFLNCVSKELKKNDYEKVLLENHPTQYLALKWRGNCKKYRGRVYYHCHNEFTGKYGCHQEISETKRFLCVSNYIRKSLVGYLGMGEEKFSVLRNCVNDFYFRKRISNNEKLLMKKRFGIDEKEKVLLFTGRIVPEKGVHELLQAIRGLNKDFKLLIVGAALFADKVKTRYQEQIEKLVKELGDKVIFTGYVDYGEIYKIYQIADIAIFPSLWNDPAPLTVIEALTSGLPIITTESGGIPEYANDKCSIILKRNNKLVNTLSDTISDLINNEVKLKEMSLEAEKAAEELTVARFYKEFTSLMN